MAKKFSRYRQMERLMTAIMAGMGIIFLIYLFCAGFGVLWLKVLTAIIALLGSALCLGFLYLTGEYLRQRSLWLTVGFGSIIVGILVSILCNYPSPLN